MADGGLWARITRWFRAERGAARAKDADRLRDQMDDAYRSQNQSLAQVRRGVAEVATSRKRVEVQLAQLRRQIDAAGVEAKAAVDGGDDLVARSALNRQVTLEKAAAELDARHATLRAEEDQLTAAAARLQGQIEEFRVRKDTLSARYSAAQARTEINSATAGIGAAAGDVHRAMDEAERHTRELEATADAVDELMNEGIIARPGESEDEAFARSFDEALGTSDTALPEGDDDGPKPLSQ